MGCRNGKFFGLEVKRSEAEARKKTGRTVLQRHVLQKIRDAGGFAEFIYPENQDDVIENLVRWSDGKN